MKLQLCTTLRSITSCCATSRYAIFGLDGVQCIFKYLPPDVPLDFGRILRSVLKLARGFKWALGYFRQIHHNLFNPNLYIGHQKWVWDCVFSVDGAYLVTASSDCSARLWDLASGEAIRVYSGHHKSVVCCALNDSAVEAWSVCQLLRQSYKALKLCSYLIKLFTKIHSCGLFVLLADWLSHYLESLLLLMRRCTALLMVVSKCWSVPFIDIRQTTSIYTWPRMSAVR